jgi:hypothetical protein
MLINVARVPAFPNLSSLTVIKVACILRKEESHGSSAELPRSSGLSPLSR